MTVAYLGPNIAQPPKWDSRDWDDVAGWHLDGDHAVAEGTTVCDAFQYGRDSAVVGDTRPGPWKTEHSTKVYLQANQLGSTGAAFRAFRWFWERSSIDGRATDAVVDLRLGDATTGGLPAIFWGNVASLAGPVSLIFGPDTDYILEMDFVGAVRVRFYEPGDEATAEWSAPMPLGVGTGVGRSRLEMYCAMAATDIFLIDRIDVAMGPGLGAEFGPLFIGWGDEVTDTFYGLPTLDGTVKWYVDGILTQPKSVNEATGEVVFDRPPQKDAVISQSGKARG